MSAAYEQAVRESISDPEAFWMAAARAVDWSTLPARAMAGATSMASSILTEMVVVLRLP